MTTRYSVEFTGWLHVNAHTTEEAIEITRRIIEETGATIMVDDIEEVHW